jgi:hypothetical protein
LSVIVGHLSDIPASSASAIESRLVGGQHKRGASCAEKRPQQDRIEGDEKRGHLEKITKRKSQGGGKLDWLNSAEVVCSLNYWLNTLSIYSLGSNCY